MITAEKVNIYKMYKGYYDGFYLQNKNHHNITSEEWKLISDFIQDLTLIRKNLASKVFENNVMTNLEESCDNQNTIIFLIELEKYLIS